MTKRRKAASLPAPTFEDKLALVQSVMDQCVDPSLLKGSPRCLSDTVYPPLIRWSFGHRSHGAYREGAQYYLSIEATYDSLSPCKPNKHTKGWGYLGAITREDIVNALFHTLSWDGSSYYLSNGGKWCKRQILYG